MRRYFPSNYTKDGDPFADERWNDLIHHGLTHSEREDVHKVGETMKAFLMKARTWDMERKAYFEKHGCVSDLIKLVSLYFSNLRSGIGSQKTRSSARVSSCRTRATSMRSSRARSTSGWCMSAYAGI